MKMKQEHYNILKSSIEDVLKNMGPALLQEYETGKFPRADKVKDLNVRFRWDLFHFIWSKMERSGKKLNLYDYLNDTHIDTALRRICPKIIKKY